MYVDLLTDSDFSDDLSNRALRIAYRTKVNKSSCNNVQIMANKLKYIPWNADAWLQLYWLSVLCRIVLVYEVSITTVTPIFDVHSHQLNLSIIVWHAKLILHKLESTQGL